MLTERWRKVRFGYYAISDLGHFKRIKDLQGNNSDTPVIPYKNSDGYLCVNTSIPGDDGHRRRKIYLVHVLVAAAFIGPKPSGKEVNHKDLVKSNNRWDNLEYLTHQENIDHAVAGGAFAFAFDRWGAKNPNSKLSVKKKGKIRELRRLGEHTLGELGSTFGVHRTTISYVLRS